MNKKISAAVFALVFALGLFALTALVTDGKMLSDYANAYYTGEATAAYAFGIQPYGLVLAIAALAGVIAAGTIVAWKSEIDVAGTLCFGAWAVVIGLVLSRVLYCATEFSFFSMEGAGLTAALRVWEGGVCMTGGVLGGIAAAFLTAKWTRNKAWLNAAAAIPLFAAIARMGEKNTHTGFGDYVDTANFFTFADEYGDPILNVWLIELVIALVVLFALLFFLRRDRGASDGLLLFLLFYGTAQLIAESLKFDGQMCWGFVKAQQLYAMLMAAAGVIAFGVQAKKFWMALIVSLAAAGAFVVLGFALDRWDVSALILYAVFIVVQIAYIAFGLYLRSKGKKA